MGHRLTLTEQMLKRHGVIGTINRNGINPKALDNLDAKQRDARDWVASSSRRIERLRAVNGM